MKPSSIIVVAIFALIASCSGAPVVNEQVDSELQARINVYEDFLSGLFTGLVQTTFGSVSNFLNQLITTNPLNVGKRDVESDLTARIDFVSFLYDNILQQFFGDIVSNTFNHLGSTLTNLIQTNPLGIGKRDAESDLAARIDFISFLYDNILQQFLGDVVSNTFNHLTGTLTNLIQTNPLGIGKRDVESDLAARIDFISFLYDNILQQFLGDVVSNTFNHLTGTLTNLIQTNPLGIGKRSVDLQQIQQLLAPVAGMLTEKLRIFARQVLALWNDRTQLAELIKNTVADIKGTIADLAQQLSVLIPETLVDKVSQGLAAVQSILVFWTSGLAGSLGPVIGPFRP